MGPVDRSLARWMRAASPAIGRGVALAAGCALKTPPDAAAIKAEALPTVAVPDAWTAAVAGAGASATTGWRPFHDDAAHRRPWPRRSPTTPTCASARRASSRRMLYAKLAGAKLYPSVDVLARGGGKMSGDGSGIQGAALTVSWELDLWGRVRYGRAAAARRCRLRAGGLRIRAPVDRRARWQGAGSWPPRRRCRRSSPARDRRRRRSSSCGWPRIAPRVGVGNDEDV